MRSGRPLRWFEVPLAFVLMVVIGTPLLNIFGGTVRTGGSPVLTGILAVAGGLCFAAYGMFQAYFSERRSLMSLWSTAVWLFGGGTVFTLVWLLWPR